LRRKKNSLLKTTLKNKFETKFQFQFSKNLNLFQKNGTQPQIWVVDSN